MAFSEGMNGHLLVDECSDIKSLADKIINELTPTHKCIYADAKHSKENEEIILPENFRKAHLRLILIISIIINSIFQNHLINFNSGRHLMMQILF